MCVCVCERERESDGGRGNISTQCRCMECVCTSISVCVCIHDIHGIPSSPLNQPELSSGGLLQYVVEDRAKNSRYSTH